MKTLKDLKFYLDEPNNICGHETVVCFWDLKQEAIKWIRKLEDYIDNSGNTDIEHKQSVINWIKYFFNITEKDLK